MTTTRLVGWGPLSFLLFELSCQCMAIAPPPTHRYYTRANHSLQMDQLRDDLIQMRTQVTAQMAQFMEVMQNMADRQEELRIRMDTVAQVVADPPQRNPADIRVNGEPVIGGPGVIPPATNQGNPYGPPQPIPEGQATQQIRRAAAIPVLEEDRHEDLFPESELGFPHDAGRLFRGLEERMRAMEGQGLGMDINDLGLVPGVRVPPKFKVPDFEKYKGNTCPKTHVRAYYRKMHVYSEDEGLLMHFFQDSLTGASLEWYMRLERANIRSWRDLVDAFIKQYQYNVDMAPNRTQLQNLSQKANESFKEYAQKWRELAARVQPPMLEREMMDLFTNTLEGQYYSACSASSSFAELVMIGERIESGIKAGRIQNPSTASSSSGAGGKKPYNGFAKKREGETSAAYYGKGKGHVYQQVAAVTIPSTPLQQQPQQQQRHPPRQYQQKSRPPRIFDPIPMTYAQLLAHLLHGDLVQLRTMGPPPAKLPPNYDANAHCEFHSGAAGHDIEHYIGFMHKVQDLLDSKAIEFTPTQGPNVVQNPMPSHGTHAANAIDIVEDIYLVRDVIELGSLLPLLKKELLRMRLYAGCGEFCTDCMVTSLVCDKVKDGIQQLIDSGYLQFEHVRHPKSVKDEINVLSIPYTPTKIPIPARAPPLVITLPGPIPYTSEKAIPWNYGGEVFYQGAKYEIKAPVEKEDVDNVVGIGRMTRSGRIFNPPQNTRDDNAEALAQAKGKRVVEDTVDPGQSSNSEDTVAKEMEEFLKIIKKSEYKVVDQLSQTQSKISILQLLLCSETHRNALLRLLSTAFVPPEISVNQLEGVVSNINAGNGLGFTDADLPSEGRNHNRALHISVECKGTMLSRVLVDNGSSLNVLPKSSLMRLDYSGVEIRPSELTVRAFDGSKRSVFGEVDLPIMIGPQLFTITFFVMDIHPSYSCLLGRPWIHAAGAVTSTLHQKLKFATQGKIVTICGEEEHVVSHLASFRYIDVEGEVHETPCQAFEAVQTIKIPYVEKKKLEAPMSSLKEAKAVVESGHPEGWGRVLDLPIKQDKCGIGYQLGQSSSNGSFKKPGTFIPIKFSSAGIVKDHICAADDDVDRKLLGFIVSERGIEVDPAKVKAIQEMPEPRTEKQVRGFLGRLNYIARFISHLTATCEPIFKLLRKNQAIKWDDNCQKAFDKVKEYLQEPSILMPPVEVKWDNEAPSIVIKRLDEPAFCGVIDNVPDEKPWFYDIKKFLETQEYPEGASLTDRKTLKRLSAKFFIAGGVLYKRNFDSVLLRCVDRHEAAKIMQEVHEGSFGTHASGHTMARKILRAGISDHSAQSDASTYASRTERSPFLQIPEFISLGDPHPRFKCSAVSIRSPYSSTKMQKFKRGGAIFKLQNKMTVFIIPFFSF
ncbi:uncharacterized protein LOC131619709 [Vicia villosa]|uniref:uncharacterized protein LOC131619709 n=1 Tax=Vicia villosa TaxID=3911 RepID=UPI00273CE0E9|nr:uncharacterized protein LOC131619709 [Vicia villosa]